MQTQETLDTTGSRSAGADTGLIAGIVVTLVVIVVLVLGAVVLFLFLFWRRRSKEHHMNGEVRKLDAISE